MPSPKTVYHDDTVSRSSTTGSPDAQRKAAVDGLGNATTSLDSPVKGAAGPPIRPSAPSATGVDHAPLLTDDGQEQGVSPGGVVSEQLLPPAEFAAAIALSSFSSHHKHTHEVVVGGHVARHDVWHVPATHWPTVHCLPNKQSFKEFRVS